MHLTVLAVGTRPPGWVREAFDDYGRRLQGRLPVRLTEIAPGAGARASALRKPWTTRVSGCSPR